MAYARKTDPLTSHMAAASVSNVTETQTHIMALLLWPLTDEELVDNYYAFAGSAGWKNASPSGIRSRRAELVRRSLVKDSGMRRKSDSGRISICWVKA